MPKKNALLAALAAAAAVAAAAGNVTLTTDGTSYTLANGAGVSATLTRGGAALQKYVTLDRDGRADDIVLGMDDAKLYETPGGNPQMMGCVVGRFINRIANATFVNADGAVVRLEANLPTGAANHGGGTAGGWCTQRWAVAGTTTDSVTFSLTSPAGFQGFPGTVVANVTYRMAADGALTATLTATADAVTAVNLAPHPYFNLDGAASRTNVRGHALQTPATLKTVLNPATLLPTGDVVSTNGTAFDFRNATLLGARWDAIPAGQAEAGVGGYEMQYVLGGHDGAAARAAVVAPCARAGVTPAATLSSPTTGRTLTLSTNAPAVVVYAGTHLGGAGGPPPKGGGAPYPVNSAVALEPQDPTDWVHHADTFSTCWLGPGVTMTRVWTLAPGVVKGGAAKDGAVAAASTRGGSR